MDEFDLPLLEDLVLDNQLADFIYFITGATPDHVCIKVMKAIPDFQKGDAAKFIIAAVISAAKQRNQLEKFLALPGMENVAGILGKHFSFKGGVNFTEMNLLGHMFLACGLKSVGAIAAVRQKFNAIHIWDADLSKASLTPKDLELVESNVNVLQFEFAHVVKIGLPTLLALVQNDKKLGPLEPAPTAVDNGGSSTVLKSEPVEMKFWFGGSDGSSGSYQIYSASYDQRLVSLEEQLQQSRDELQREREERRHAEERMKAHVLAQHEFLVQLCAQSGFPPPPPPTLFVE
ncbi:uncharacterized protein LOC131005968 isoform X2 [Salvia miltiorrhiza]|uniref:uncharacterized protein LOC131005968 isoform X2 n=1 Tax=Salvia miltiorrhiza TaxID=226208 RepID=UPI0025AC8EC3|nr:uncharacterized protein LOC131005968 isoform X2 [Salvia miltiorrhiza]